MDLAGRLQLTPGVSLGHALQSSRREWAPVISRGCAADALPALLASAFALCGGAHRLAAQLAVAAARGRVAPATEDQLRLLARDTLSEHLRRLWLDAPALVPAVQRPPASALLNCPVLQSGAPAEAADTVGWLEAQVLGEPAPAWLQAWQRDPPTQARNWSIDGRTWPARWLAALRHALGGLSLRPRGLRLADLLAHSEALVEQCLHTPTYALQPLWNGEAAETGPWTREHDLASMPAWPATFGPVWLRAAARVAEVVGLALPQGAQTLSAGAVSVEPGLGLAWCEMARGLLLHVVRLDKSEHVADCRVLAPTEWNFHPRGSVAQLLSQLPSDAPALRVQALAMAFDPCVAFDIRVARELTHA